MTKEIIINNAYLPLIESTARVVRLQGGAGSGKSIAIAQVLLFLTMDRKPNRIFVFRKVGRTVRDSVFQTFIDLINENGLQPFYNVNRSTFTITNTQTQNAIICGGMDDPEKVKSIKDPTVIWMEEATEFHDKDFQQLNLRLRKQGARNQIFISYNPINTDSWIYKRFVEQGYENEFFLKTTHRDNAYLPESYRQELEGLAKTDKNYHKIYTLGEWGEAVEGLIFPDYEVIEQFPECKTIVHGLDFGFNDPMVLVRVGINELDVYADCLYYERETTIPEFITRLPALGVTPNDRIYCDSANPGDIQQINNNGYYLAKPATKGQKSVVSGIRQLKGMNIHVTARSTELIRELNKYRWEEKKDGSLHDEVPIDAFNHAIDALRYAVYSHTYKPLLTPTPRRSRQPRKTKPLR